MVHPRSSDISLDVRQPKSDTKSSAAPIRTFYPNCQHWADLFLRSTDFSRELKGWAGRGLCAPTDGRRPETAATAPPLGFAAGGGAHGRIVRSRLLPGVEPCPPGSDSTPRRGFGGGVGVDPGEHEMTRPGRLAKHGQNKPVQRSVCVPVPLVPFPPGPAKVPAPHAWQRAVLKGPIPQQFPDLLAQSEWREGFLDERHVLAEHAVAQHDVVGIARHKKDFNAWTQG